MHIQGFELKRILFFFYFFSTAILPNEYTNYPFDWTNHFGVISENGRVIWNDDWMYGLLFFDGTFTNYPKRYGLDLDENFSLFKNRNIPNQQYELDTSFVNTRIQYSQGDYYLDMLSVNTEYVDRNRLISMNGFKKTYTGPYSDYSLGILNPIQQSYFVEYNSNHLQAAIGHFVTSSGIPDSSANGSLNDRIFNASILTKGLIKNWEWKLYGSQFNQKYSVDHSSWYNPSNQYLNRSIIQANIINQIKESIIIGFGLSYNFRGLSNIDSFTSNKWGSIYSNISLKHFKIRGGLSSINNKYNPFFNLLFHLGNKNKGLSIKTNKEIKPINELIKINDLNSESETTNSIVMNAWYSFSNLTIKSNLFSQNVFQNDNNKIEIQGFDLNLIINIFDNWILSGNMRHLSNPNNFTDGVGNILEFKLLANENLFKNNMTILIDLGLTGWINRKSNISFNPYYCRPILVNDSNFILNDQWSLNSTISIKVSSLKVSWMLNNVLSVLQSSIDSINDEQTMIINNYLLHQNNRNMGRLMQIHIDWYFLD